MKPERDFWRAYETALDESAPGPSAAQRDAALSRAADSPPRRARRYAAAGAMIALAAAGVLAFVFWPKPEPGIVCLHEGAPIGAGRWIRASRPEALLFSDGSSVTLAEASRVRLSTMTHRSVDVHVEDGELAIHVEPEGPRRWRFLAGPFEVHVIGTDLVVRWESDRSSLDVEVSHGLVEVRDEEGRRVQVAASEALTMTRGRHELRRVETEGGADIDAELEAIDRPPEDDLALFARDELTGAPTDDARRERSTLPGRGDMPSTAPTGWQELAQAGDYDAAYDAAAARGLDAQRRTLSAAELLELSDVCRLARQGAEAARTLDAIRTRFPGSGQAAAAAFRRGRMAADRGADTESHRWFEIYLREEPRGRFAAEAAGRALESAPSSARAREYLGRYPNGPYRRLAESLLAPE